MGQWRGSRQEHEGLVVLHKGIKGGLLRGSKPRRNRLIDDDQVELAQKRAGKNLGVAGLIEKPAVVHSKLLQPVAIGFRAGFGLRTEHQQMRLAADTRKHRDKQAGPLRARSIGINGIIA